MMPGHREGNHDFLAERIALDAFSNTGTALSPPLKYDRNVPFKYFIEKYAGGPFSNVESRKSVSIKVMVRAAIKI